MKRATAAVLVLTALAVGEARAQQLIAPGGGSSSARNICEYPQSCTDPQEILVQISTDEMGNGDIRLQLAPHSWWDNEYPAVAVPRETWWISSVQELRRKMHRAARRCKRIKYMALVSHGGLGSLAIDQENDEHISVRNIDVFDGLSCVMAEDAEIRLGGCNVGRGCRGSDFLLEMADTLLRGKGGTIYANNNYAATLGGITPLTSIDGQVNRLRVNADLSSRQWNPSPDSAEACRERVLELDRNMRSIAHSSALRRCTYKGKRLPKIYESWHATFIGIARSYESMSTANERLSLGEEARATAERMYSAVDFGNWFVRNIADRATCPEPSRRAREATERCIDWIAVGGIRRCVSAGGRASD